MLIVVYYLGDNRHSKMHDIEPYSLLQGVLTHEVDEGSKCLQCGDGCPGFSLHFWRLVAFHEIYLPCNIFSLSRKVCKNCLCPREEHDVRHPEERQTMVGKILFSPDADTYQKEYENGPHNKSVLIITVSNHYEFIIAEVECN